MEAKFEKDKKLRMFEKNKEIQKIKQKLVDDLNEKKTEYDQLCKSKEEEIKKHYENIELKWQTPDFNLI